MIKITTNNQGIVNTHNLENKKMENLRARKVSIDSTFEPIKVPVINKYDQKEKQITSQKEQLIQMMNQKKSGGSPVKNGEMSEKVVNTLEIHPST